MKTPILRSAIVRKVGYQVPVQRQYLSQTLIPWNSFRPCTTVSYGRATVPTWSVQSSPLKKITCLLPVSSSTMMIRQYHSSPVQELPVRRRRVPPGTTSSTTTNHNNNSDSSEEVGQKRSSALKHSSVDDDTEFVRAATMLLDKLEKALQPMKPPMNDFFVMERFFGDFGEVLTIDLGPKEGKYRIEMSLDDHVFEYSSPISGKILYVLSAETGEWVGMEDGHSFEGLLVRDLIRQCRGLPNL